MASMRSLSRRHQMEEAAYRNVVFADDEETYATRPAAPTR